MAFRKGKNSGIKSTLESSGYEKLDKANMTKDQGILIDGIHRGHSADNGDFIYISGSYNNKMVYTAVPAASMDDFIGIDDNDLNEIRQNGYKMYVESRISKNGRQYYIAWIDD